MPGNKASTISRMIVAFGAAVILILWASFAAFLALTRETQLDAAGATSAAMALAIEQHAETVFAAADSVLTTIAAEIVEIAADDPAQDERIDELLERNIARQKYLVSLVITDEAGRLQHDARFDEVPPIDLSDR